MFRQTDIFILIYEKIGYHWEENERKALGYPPHEI